MAYQQLLSKYSRNTCEAIHFQRSCRLVEASKLSKSGIPSEMFFKYFHHQSKDAFSKMKKKTQIIVMIVYIGTTCSHSAKFRSSHSAKVFQRTTAQVSFKYFVH